MIENLSGTRACGKFVRVLCAFLGVVSLGGCPLTDSEVLTKGFWRIDLSPDEGPPVSELESNGWEWFFTEDGLLEWNGFPDRKFKTTIPFEIGDHEIRIEGALQVAQYRSYHTVESEYDALREGDVFGHAEITLESTRLSFNYDSNTTVGTYTFTLSEEWGGQTFSGSFRGQQIVRVLF